MRAAGRAARSALTTSSPLPSPRRRSTTAKAGGCAVAAAVPVATLSAVETTKPRRSIARASRWHSGASSSTTSSVRSASDRPRSRVASSSVAAGCWGRSLAFIFRSLVVSCRAGSCGIVPRLRLQIGTIPGNDNMRAAFDEIVEGQFGAAALQQALRDENAEPHMARGAGPGRQVGLAEPTEQMRRKARSVIGDLDRDAVLVPRRRDADLLTRELQRVLDQVVDAMDDLGAAPHHRLGLGGVVGGREDQSDAWIVRQRAGLDQRRDRQPLIGRAGVLLRLMGQFGEDPPAALGLAQEQRGVFGMW